MFKIILDNDILLDLLYIIKTNKLKLSFSEIIENISKSVKVINNIKGDK